MISIYGCKDNHRFHSTLLLIIKRFDLKTCLDSSCLCVLEFYVYLTVTRQFVQMNIDRPVYTKIDITLYCHNGFRLLRGCLFYLSGVPKKPDFRTRHRWSEWTFRRNTSNIGWSGHFFLDGVYINVKLLRTKPVSRVCRLNALYRFVYIFK